MVLEFLLQDQIKLSTDKATNIDVALHAVEKVKCDILIILQPTSPLRKTSDITAL